MATQNSWNSPNFESYERQNFTGFYEWDGAGAYYSVAGTDFTLLRGGTGYIQNTPLTWLGGQSTGALSAGETHYVYIDSTGTIQSTSTRSHALFKENIVLFEVFVDASSDVIVVRENHPYDFPVDTSEYLHYTIGSVIDNTQGGANITLNGTKGIQINGADILTDHGLSTVIPDSSATAVNFSFMYTNGAGKWDRHSVANTFPSLYNNAGTPTALTGNKYGVFRLYVSKDDLNSSTPTYYAVMHTAEFNNQTAADTAIADGSIATASNEFFDIEVAQLGYVIKEESSDTIVDVIIAKGTLRSSTSVASSNEASLVNTNTTNFDGWLDATNTTVQSCLDELDDVLIGGTSGQIVTSTGAGNQPTYTTATYPSTTSAGEVLLSNADNTVTSGNSLTGDFTYTGSTAGSDRTLTVTNTDNSDTASHAVIRSVSGGTSGGDGKFQSVVDSGQTWSFGGDNSDSDSFVLSANANLGTTNVFESTTTGIISTPLNPVVVAYLSAGVTNVTGDGTEYTIALNATDIDTQSEFNTSTHKYVATEAGYYHISTRIFLGEINANHDTGSVRIRKNSSTEIIYSPLSLATDNSQHTVEFSAIASLAASDEITTTITINNDTKTVDIAGGGSRFTALTIHKIG